MTSFRSVFKNETLNHLSITFYADDGIFTSFSEPRFGVVLIHLALKLGYVTLQS